jgi:hypothetical protein
MAPLKPKASEPTATGRAADFTLQIAPMMVELAPQVVIAAQSNAIQPFDTRVLAWRCRREIQFGRLGALLALDSEHCGPGEELRKTFTMIDSRSTTLDKPVTVVSLDSAETDRMSP